MSEVSVILVVYIGVLSVLPFYHQPHSELIHSLQNKLLSCFIREVAPGRSVLAGEAAAGQAGAGSHPQEAQSLLLLPSQVLTSQPGDAIFEVARFGDGPWASCLGFIFPIQQSKLTEPEKKTTCQFLHILLNTALGFDND